MPRPAGGELTAKEIMHKHVVTVDPEMTVQEVTQLFLDRQITGAPVVDEDDKLVGVISQTDLLRYQRRATPANTQVPSYYHDSDSEALVILMQRDTSDTDTRRVRDIMTPAAFMTEEDTPIREVARFMLRRHVHRIIVTHKDKLSGIITSMDLLRALLRPRRRTSSGRRQTRSAAALR